MNRKGGAMRGWLAGSLTFSLGIWVAGAPAAETPDPPARPRLAALGRPVAYDPEKEPTASPGPITDRQFTPAAFVPPAPLPGDVPGKLTATEIPLPMPRGPADSLTKQERTSDKPAPDAKSDQKPQTERLKPEPLPNAPTPVPGPIIVSETPAGTPCDGTTCTEVCPDCDWFGPRWHCRECIQDQGCIWFTGEYLLWWVKDAHLPALVTTSPDFTPREMAGVLGQPGTAVLFGGPGVDYDVRSGGRFSLGFWLDHDRIWGLESTTFFLGERSVNFATGSGGSPILARPFFDAVAGREASELVAFPGVLAGNVAVSTYSRLWGTELNLRTNCWRSCTWHMDWLTGVRYIGLQEGLSISENLTVPLDGSPLAGSGITVMDQFATRNNFFGGQLGTEIGVRRGPWSLDLTGKVALGNTRESVSINGATAFAVPGSPVTTQPGGLLALPTNSGHFTRDRFGIVPEAGVKVGYQVTDHMRLFVTYSFLYMSEVVRPGNQIDRVINVSQLPSQVGPGVITPPARPVAMFKSTDFWAQGLGFGMEFRY